MKSINRLNFRMIFTYTIIFIVLIGVQSNFKYRENKDFIDTRELKLSTSSETDQKKPLWISLLGEYIQDVAMSTDGSYIAVGTTNNIYLFNKNSPAPILNYSTTYGGRFIAISSNGSYIAAANGGGGVGKLFFFHQSSSTPLWNFSVPQAATSVAISSDGKYIALGSYDWKVRLFHWSNSTPLWTFSAPSVIDVVDISSDGNYISAGVGAIANHEKIYLFEKSSSIPIWNYSLYNRIVSMAISSDGNYIVAGTYQDKLYLFNKTSSTPMWIFSTGGYTIWTVEFSFDSNYIVAGIENGGGKVYFFNRSNSIPLWNYSTGTNAYVSTVAISSNGSYIIIGNTNYISESDTNIGNVYFFHKNSRLPIWHYRTGRYVWGVSISSDGTYCAVGSTDGFYFFDNTIHGQLGIPGFNLYLLLGIASIICILSIKVNLKTKFKRW